MFMFINQVFATEAINNTPSNFQGGIAGFVPLFLFFVVFYFLLIRPQQKREKEHKKEIEGLKVGDKVITAGGIYGIIVAKKEKNIVLEIANGVNIDIIPETLTLLKEDKELDKTNNVNKKAEKSTTTKKETIKKTKKDKDTKEVKNTTKKDKK